MLQLTNNLQPIPYGKNLNSQTHLNTLTTIEDIESLKELQQFLEFHKLPSSDLKLDGTLFIAMYDANRKLVASGGLEQHGETGLLRSLAVEEKLRNRSLGKEIVQTIIERAKKLKIKNLYLLTETAHNYFLKKGFEDVPRDFVPETIKQTTEFSQVCPSSAIVMKLTIHQ